MTTENVAQFLADFSMDGTRVACPFQAFYPGQAFEAGAKVVRVREKIEKMRKTHKFPTR